MAMVDEDGDCWLVVKDVVCLDMLNSGCVCDQSDLLSKVGCCDILNSGVEMDRKPSIYTRIL